MGCASGCGVSPSLWTTLVVVCISLTQPVESGSTLTVPTIHCQPCPLTPPPGFYYKNFVSTRGWKFFGSAGKSRNNTIELISEKPLLGEKTVPTPASLAPALIPRCRSGRFVPSGLSARSIGTRCAGRPWCSSSDTVRAGVRDEASLSNAGSRHHEQRWRGFCPGNGISSVATEVDVNLAAGGRCGSRSVLTPWVILETRVGAQTARRTTQLGVCSARLD